MLMFILMRALVCFVRAAVNVRSPRVSLIALDLSLWVAALLVG